MSTGLASLAGEFARRHDLRLTVKGLIPIEARRRAGAVRVFLSVFEDYDAFEKHFTGVLHDWLEANYFLLSNGNLFVVSEWLTRQAEFVRRIMVTQQPAMSASY